MLLTGQDAFRAAMGHVAAPVAIVTTVSDGRPAGSTVSAFLSLSMEPPMVLVSLDNRSALLASLGLGAPVGVNILAADQAPLAALFATRGADRFGATPWSLVDEAPALAGTHAWVGTRLGSLVPAGDHTLAMLDVVSATSAEREPLVYHRRSYGTHRPHR